MMMRASRLFRIAIPLAPLVVVLASCDGAGQQHLVSPEGSGHLEGVTFLDLSRDGRVRGGESPLSGIRVAFVTRGSQDTVRIADSDEEGEFRLEDLPAGTYDVGVSGALLGDTLVFSATDPSPVEVSPGATRSVSVGVSFPAYGPVQLAARPSGERVYVEGIGLNPPGAVGDGAVHVWDGQRAVRALSVSGFGMSAGDSVRILGRTAVRSGRIVLVDGTGFRVRELPAPQPIEVSAARAATAGQAGELDAALVRVARVEVLSESISGGSHLLVASDGSGSLRIRVANAHLSEAGIPALQPGARLSVTGVLVPRQGDPGWELRTRGGGDLAPEGGGTIAGTAFYDENGDGGLDEEEPTLVGVRLSLHREGGGSGTVRSAQSGAGGSFVFDDVEVGPYRIEVDPASIPDSLVVRRIDPEVVNVPIMDTARVEIAITHPAATVEEVRLMPEGRTVFIEGIALNGTQTFGNHTVHLRGSSRAIRGFDVQAPTVSTGAQVRVRARTGRVLGQPALLQVVPFAVTGSGSPSRVTLSSAEAAAARGGEQDANLVEVREATVVSSQAGQGVRTLVVNDGSGALVVSVRLATVNMTDAQAQETFVPGRVFNISGVLIPVEGEGGWRLHPRARSDLVRVP